MKILYVHECFGALAGAEANAQITAEELGRRGHAIGLLIVLILLESMIRKNQKRGMN